MAAGLIASAARRSDEWDEGKGVSAQAQALRSRVERLAEANEEAYLEALALIEGASEDGGRDEAIGKALDTAAELPLSIAECAYDVALLGAEAAQHACRGGAEDAAAASILAEAAARSAAGLVAANLVSRRATSASCRRSGSPTPRRTLHGAPSRHQPPGSGRATVRTPA